MGKRSSAAQLGLGAAMTVRENPAPYVAPAAGALANLVLSGVLSLLWGAHAKDATVWSTAWRSAVIVLASVAVIAVTWAAGRARQPVLRAVSMGMSVVSCAGMWVLTFAGWSFDLVVVYILAMVVACLGLAIVRLLRGDGTDARPSVFGEVAERVNELKAVGAMSKPKVIDGVVTSRVRMEPGTEFAELQKAQGAIATLVPTRKTNVRLIPDPDRPGEGEMEITAHDYIETPPPWPGLSSPGGSISEPIRLMVYGNGRVVPLYLFGDADKHRNAIGLFVIAGQPGSGKTELVLEFSGEVISRYNANLTVIDPRKGPQLPEWLKRAARVISDMGEAETYIAALVDEVPRRAAVLGREGLKEWTPQSSLKAEVVVIDEAAKLIADRNEAELVELAESIRSVGINMVLVLQRVTVDRMPSSVKKARGGAICLGVADDKEAARLLSESTMEAGASPGSLKNLKPGCLYIEVPGIPEAEWSRMARTYMPPKPQVLADAVAPFITGRPAATVATARPKPATPAPRQSEVDLDALDGEIVEDGDDRDGPVRDGDRLDTRDDDPQVRPEPQHADTPLTEAGDPRTPIVVPPKAPGSPPGPRLRLAVPEDRWTKPALLDLLRRTLADAYAQGRTRIKPADLGPVVEYVGPDNLKPPRLSAYLGELCRDGLLRRVEGGYVINPPDEAGDRVLVGASR